jgi:hypothetical protein
LPDNGWAAAASSPLSESTQTASKKIIKKFPKFQILTGFEEI